MMPIKFEVKHRPDGGKVALMDFLGRPELTQKVDVLDIKVLLERVEELCREMDVSR